MPVTVISSSATFNIKQGTGRVRRLSCPNAGTSWTLQINDGPDSAGNVQRLYGASAGTITTGIGIPFEPIVFRDGLQIVTSGTAGELDVDWI
jgi:hypothetical protein